MKIKHAILPALLLAGLAAGISQTASADDGRITIIYRGGDYSHPARHHDQSYCRHYREHSTFLGGWLLHGDERHDGKRHFKRDRKHDYRHRAQRGHSQHNRQGGHDDDRHHESRLSLGIGYTGRL